MSKAAINTIMEDAKAAGLLAGDKTAHISIRTTEALLRAAKAQTGIASTTQVVEYALAALAIPDPIAKFMEDHFGQLGPDHQLDI